MNFAALLYVPAWFALALLVPALLFCIKQKKRRYFWLRLVPSVIAYNVLPFVIPGSYASEYLSIGWFSFGYLIFALLAAGILFLCFELKPISIAFYVSAAYAMQFTAFNLWSLIIMIIGMAGGNAAWYVQAPIGVVAYAAVYVPMFFLFIRRSRDYMYDSVRTRITVTSAATIFIVYIVDMALRTHGYINIGTCVYSIVVGMLLIFAMTGIFRETKYERERVILAELLRQEVKQHKLSEQNVNIMNIKFHDLKHMIQSARSGDADGLDEIENAVDIYDSFVKSGNAVLDVVLTEKSLICKNNKIKLGIIADGEAVAFMSDADISALFGNLLDNAAEAAQKADESERAISLNVSRQKGMLVIHQDNTCADAPEFEDGLPKTSKADTEFHGFGTKSIRLIAEKYGGRLNMYCDGNVFNADIVIPLG